jgi:serine/threonine-protein kinase
LRGLEQFDATPIPGTQDGVGPFFSPDGQWIGFFAQNQIKKIPVGGGPPVVICDAPRAPIGQGLFGASWAEDGTIFFSVGGDGISKVTSGGGSPAVVTTSNVAKGERHLLPQSLPGGKAVMFTVVTSFEWDKAQIVLHSLETGERRVLIQGGADARYVQTGHLLYMKIGTLMAVPFDVRTLQVVGDPVALLDSVMQAVNHPSTGDETGAGQFTVSNSETLAYVTGGVHPISAGALVWVDRKGAAQPLPSVPAGGVRRLLSPRFSTDEGRVALSIQERSNPSMDLWVYDTLRGAPIRLTTGGSNWPPVWSPDGRRLAFGSTGSGPRNLYVVNADGSGQTERLTTSEFLQAPSSWTAQGNLIAFRENHPPIGQIWVLPVDGDRKPRLFLESGFDLQYPEFSPDGRWLAYVSAESTPAAVYVQPYPGPGPKHRISTEGGSEPIWVANGRELLYRSGPKFFSVAITSLDPFRAEVPRVLFESKPNEYDSTGGVRGWDVSRDGQRFLLVRREESKDKPVTQIQVVLNWAEELKRRVPAAR